MTQNLVSLDLGAEDITAIDKALDTLEARFARLVVLTPDEIRHLNKMGDKSEAFCRQAAVVLEDNPKLIPPGFSVADLRQMARQRRQALRAAGLLEQQKKEEQAEQSRS